MAAARRILLTVLAVALVAPACSTSKAEQAAPTTTSSTSTSTSTTTTSTSTTTTTAPPPPTPPAGLRKGSTGPEVAAMEQKLAAMHYDVGTIDDVFDTGTYQAVMAFQKVEGLERTGVALPDTVSRIHAATQPPPMLPDGGPTRVEVDLKRQVLFLYRDGGLDRVIMVSTGNNKRYCVQGDCSVAVTPGGSYRIGRKISGIRVSRLGKLWNPLYFNGGIAIHGAPSVPASPASHGCVRIPMSISRWFYETVPIGTPVYVLGGSRAAVPFNEQAPTEDEAAETTTTTAPPTTTTAPPPSTTSTTAAPVTAPTTSSTSTSTSTTLPAS